jgi:Mor family transcriptional regulator
MSDVVRRVAINLVRSKAFLDTFTELVSAELERQLRNESGGEQIYIAKICSNTDKKTRNDLIRAQFTGRNLDDLCRKHGLSMRQVYRICNGK